MICDCGQLTKKRTLLDGIKSLTGTLIVFKVSRGDSEEYHLKRCCFMTLIPCLYTFVDKSWLTYSDIIVFDPNTTQIHPEDTRTFGTNMVIQPTFNVKEATLNRLSQLGDNQFKIVYVQSARLIAPEYERAINSLSMAHHKVIALEHILNDLKYKYSSAVHDNELLTLNTSVSVDQIDSIETPQPTCERCIHIKAVKDSLKQIKHDAHEQITKVQYEMTKQNELTKQLQIDVKRLEDENLKLKEINRSLYMKR